VPSSFRSSTFPTNHSPFPVQSASTTSPTCR
jgi:hypothetical protein